MYLQVRRTASEGILGLGPTQEDQFWGLNQAFWDRMPGKPFKHCPRALEGEGWDTPPPQYFTALHGTVLQRGLGWNFTSQMFLNSMLLASYLQNPSSKDVNHRIQKQILLCLLKLGLVWLPLTRLKNQMCLRASSKSSVWNIVKPSEQQPFAS